MLLVTPLRSSFDTHGSHTVNGGKLLHAVKWADWQWECKAYAYLAKGEDEESDDDVETSGQEKGPAPGLVLRHMLGNSLCHVRHHNLCDTATCTKTCLPLSGKQVAHQSSSYPIKGSSQQPECSSLSPQLSDRHRKASHSNGQTFNATGSTGRGYRQALMHTCGQG